MFPIAASLAAIAAVHGAMKATDSLAPVVVDAAANRAGYSNNSINNNNTPSNFRDSQLAQRLALAS